MFLVQGLVHGSCSVNYCDYSQLLFYPSHLQSSKLRLKDFGKTTQKLLGGGFSSKWGLGALIS